MNVLDLFSGIGGFSLGLERAGMRTVAFCERDAFCRRVLAKHWPSVPIFEDVQTLKGADIAERVDLICGGFPCQDISFAGLGAGIDGDRSGLWKEFFRLIRELRPRFVIVENVAALLGRGIGVVVGDLASIGYDAEWDCIPASAVGAHQERDRVWIVAYPSAQRPTEARPNRERTSKRAGSSRPLLADASSGPSRTQKPRQRKGSYEQERPRILSSLGGCHGMLGRTEIIGRAIMSLAEQEKAS